MLRALLIGGVAAFLLLADWFADGVGPRIVLGSATLHVTSTPAGAVVLADGERIGVTPLRYDMRPGAVVLRLEHRYREAVAQRIEAGRDQRRRIHVDLPVAKAALRVVSNPRGAHVTIDGQTLDGAAPILLSPYPAGAYEITASIEGWQAQTRTVEVLPNTRADVAFELERVPAGEVHLDLSPRDASVRIVGVDEPYRPGIRLPRGTHAVRVERVGYAPRTVEFPVLLGRNEYAVRLARLQALLTVATEPAHATVDVSYDDGTSWRDVRYAGPVALPAGEAVVAARAVGYRNYRRRLTLGEGPRRHTIRMQPFDVEAGRVFRDRLASGANGPELVVIPAGVFRMGSTDGPLDERPAHDVAITQPFAIGVYETTQADYDRYAGDPPPLRQPVAGEPALPVPPDALSRHPVTDVTWANATAYAAWLTSETGYRYRLPSEAEWEYVARAGSPARYPFGHDPAGLCEDANIADRTLADRYGKYSTAPCTDGALGVVAAGGFKANAFGAYDMLGNAEEWVADCWRRNYRDADGTPRPHAGACTAHAVRGGAWDSAPDEATVSFRSFSTGANPGRGFRVVREL